MAVLLYEGESLDDINQAISNYNQDWKIIVYFNGYNQINNDIINLLG